MDGIRGRGGLSASIETYPGYTGDLAISKGKVFVKFEEDSDEMKVHYGLKGVDTNCTSCGIFIHTGTSCDNATLIGDTYYSTDTNPWTTANGAAYSIESGKECAKGSFNITTGYNSTQTDGHAVVVYSSTGEAYGCGVLSEKSRDSFNIFNAIEDLFN